MNVALVLDARAPLLTRGDFIFVYFRKGAHLGSTPWNGELVLAKVIARHGVLRRGADHVQIRANTLDGPLIWEERHTL
jgi:hypothetical protein